MGWRGSVPFNRICNNTILRSPKQQIWLSTALSGGRCRCMALRNLRVACQKRRRRWHLSARERSVEKVDLLASQEGSGYGLIIIIIINLWHIYVCRRVSESFISSTRMNQWRTTDERQLDDHRQWASFRHESHCPCSGRVCCRIWTYTPVSQH